MSRLGTVPHALFAEKAETFLAVHRGQDSTRFAGNLVTRIDAVPAGDLTLPVTVNDGSEPPGNAWVCSPTTTYGRYALEESERLLPGLLRPPLRAAISVVDRGMRRRRLDRAVAVDNWLLSTNLHPDLAGIDLDRLVREARERWSEHAIWIRSLNTVQHPDWLRAVVEAGFTLIPSRQVYLFRGLSVDPPRRDLRRDLRLLDRTELTAVPHDDFTEDDFAQAERLYAQLYVDKYSALNPRYTAVFLRAWHRVGLLEFAGFRDAEGTLRAVVGMFGQGAALTAPVVGYDTSWPQHAGLYRLLMAHVLRSTRQRGVELNLSAGAAQFKRLRGGEPAIEYSAVQAAHLPAGTRRAIAALGALATRVGVPIMRHWAL